MDKYETTLPPVSASRATAKANTGRPTRPTTARPPKTLENAPRPAVFMRARPQRYRIAPRYRIHHRRPQSARYHYDLRPQPRYHADRPWKRQNIETELRPGNGYYLDGKNRRNAGQLPVLHRYGARHRSRRLFLHARKQKLGTFIVRGQAGYAYAREGEDVPSSLMFRTGGASSVRAVTNSTASVWQVRTIPSSPIGHYWSAALNTTPITKSVSGAVFHDVGDAAGNFKRMSRKHGTGPSAVLGSALVAPFSFDVAYGHQDKTPLAHQFGLHGFVVRHQKAGVRDGIPCFLCGMWKPHTSGFGKPTDCSRQKRGQTKPFCQKIKGKLTAVF